MARANKDKTVIRLRPVRLVCYMFLWTAVCLAYLFLKSHFVLTVLLVMLLLPVGSIVSAWRMRQYVSLQIVPLWRRVRDGQEGVWHFRLQNAGYGLSMSCTLFGTVENVFLQTAGDLEVEMPISMKYTETMDLPLGMEYPGLARVQVSYLEYQDPMGFVVVRMPSTAAGECAVLPREREHGIDQREGYQAGVTEAEETLAQGSDFSEVTDMREYRPGDRIKDIHWKLSAKRQDLMVKERASAAQSQVVLLLDLSGDAVAVTQVLELAYGISKEFLQEAVPVRLVWWNPVKDDFEETLIAQSDALEDGFECLMHGHVCRTQCDLPELLHRVWPTLLSFVYLRTGQGQADGEVISRA